MQKINGFIKKMFVYMLIISIFLCNYSFAADNTNNFLGILSSLISFLQYFWIIPAIIAGKLMTNDWVYGSIFHLDVYLWQLWNIMKNFANYALGFIFVFVILKSFIKGNPGSEVKKYLPKIFFASVAVQMSWFLVGAILDVSNIMVAAVGSLPRYIISQNDTLNKSIMKVQMPSSCTFNLDFQNTKTSTTDCDMTSGEGENVNGMIDKILPKSNNLSGPLMYFGLSVLGVHGMTNISDDISLKNITVKLILKLLIIVAFAIPIVVLMVVNFIRIFWLWAFIVFVPFLIIKSFFGDMFKSSGGVSKNLTISKFIGLAFQPVAVVGGLSLALIFIISMQNVFSIDKTDDKKTIENAEVLNKNLYMTGNGIDFYGNQIVVDGSLMDKTKDVVGGVFGYLILALFTIFAMWYLVKLGFQSSEITQSVSNGLFKFSEDIMKSAPVFPGGLSLGALSQAKSSFKSNTFDNLAATQAKDLERVFGKVAGFDDDLLNSSDMNELQKALKITAVPTRTKDYFNTIKNISKSKSSFILGTKQNTGIVKEFIEKTDLSDLKNLGIFTNIEKIKNSKGEIDDVALKSDTKFNQFLSYVMSPDVESISDKINDWQPKLDKYTKDSNSIWTDNLGNKSK